MKQLIKLTGIAVLIFFTLSLKSQISGVCTVPGTYSSIAAVINTLNAQGVSGAVTVNIAAGYTETAPAGGFKLYSTVGSSAASPVTFRKNGSGANPLITAYTGTATTSSAVQDGIWWLIGADYITIDGINLTDPNTSNPATMEFGYGFYRASATDGCQHNTIKNCVITLNKFNVDYSNTATLMDNGARGIDLSCASYSMNTQFLTATTAAGENSYNAMYSNLISNCHVGMALVANPASTTFIDKQNDVGGLLAATGNTIVNYGSIASAREAVGVIAIGQTAINVSWNYFNNNAGGLGDDALAGVHAVWLDQSASVMAGISHNTITLHYTSNFVGGNGYSLVGIRNDAVTSTLTISNNLFTDFDYPNSGSSGMCRIIYSSGTGGLLNIIGNTAQNLHMKYGYMQPIILNSDATANITGNTITNVSGNFDAMKGIICAGTIQNISNNLIDGVVASFNSSYPNGIDMALIASQQASQLSVTGNTLTNIQSSRVFGITGLIPPSPAVIAINNNSISGITNAPGATDGGFFRGVYYSSTSAFNNTISILGNTIYSVTSNGTNNSSSSSMVGIELENNTIYTVSANISNNKIYSMFSANSYFVEGIRLKKITPKISNNIITGLGIAVITPNTQSVYLSAINLQNCISSQVCFNSIYLNNTAGSAIDVNTAAFSTSGGDYTLKNNIFVNISTATGTGSTSIINVQGPGILTGYGMFSDNNIFYTGQPASNKALLINGSTAYQSLSSFQTYVAPRESVSVIEYPPFVTLNGAAPNTLDILTTVETHVESGGTPVAGITTDYAGNARNVSTPDIGAWEGNYLQVLPPLLTAPAFTGDACNLTSRTMTAVLSDASGVAGGPFAPKIYYKVGSAAAYASSPGVLISGTATNGVWSFNLSYAAVSGNVIRYFIAAQDQSSPANAETVPSAGAMLNDVNTIIAPPSAPDSYSVTAPVISASNGTICTGESFLISPSGAVTYTFSGGTANISPTVSTSYTVTGTDFNGCNASATLTVSVDLCTGLLSLSQQELSVSVFPNPVQEVLFITGQETGKEISVELYNVTGQLVMQAESVNANASFNIGHLAQGVYFIKIQQPGKNTQSLKIIKQ